MKSINYQVGWKTRGKKLSSTAHLLYSLNYYDYQVDSGRVEE